MLWTDKAPNSIAALPLVCPLAGVPASQLRLVTDSLGTDDDGGRPSVVYKFLSQVFRQTHVAADNYFYFAYFYGKYSRDCCPRLMD